MYPRVICLEPTAPGAGSLTEAASVPHFDALDIRQALEKEWSFDAHFTLYTLPDDKAWPRLKKSILPELQDDLDVWLVSLDYDTPGHEAINSTHVAAIKETVNDPNVPTPWCWYTTAHGCRLLYLLSRPVDPMDAEDLHRGLSLLWESAGTPVDPTVWDWTRLHRLPQVRREGKLTQNAPHYECHWPETLLDPDTVERPPRLRASPNVSLIHAPLPNPQTCLSLIWTPAQNGNLKLTSWAKGAKSRLRGRMDGEIDKLFDVSPPPIPDPRNPTIMAWAGSICSMLEHYPDTTPEHVYGILLPAVEQSQRQDGRDLPAEAWKMVCYCWAKQQALDEHYLFEKETLQSRVLSNLRRLWRDPPAIPEGQEAEWLSRHAIVSIGRDYHVLQANGLYDSEPATREMLPATLRDSGLAGDASGRGGIVSLMRPSQRSPAEGMVSVRVEELLLKHATKASTRALTGMGPKGGQLTPDGSVYFGTWGRRDDLTPKRDENVDEWLRLLGGEHYERLCLWIGLALAVERGPICALSINAPPGSGKKLLARGLVECFWPDETITAENVFGRFHYMRDKAPVIVVNEAWPTTREVDGKFRALVSGDEVAEERKYSHPTLTATPFRLLLTANNRGVVEKLFERKTMSASDQEAISQRLFHFEPDNSAAAWLERKGGLSWTHGWIKGPNGEPSRLTVARHFLWLYQKHGQKGGASRFLMSGATPPELIWKLTASAGVTPIVGHLLVSFVESGRAELDPWGDVRHTSADLLKHYQLNLQADYRETFNASTLGRATLPFEKPKSLVPHSYQVEGEQRRGKAIDLGKLRDFARSVGLKCPKIEELLTAQKEKA